MLLELRPPTPRWSSAETSVGPASELVVTTLGDLDPDVVDMRCLLIVGSAGTSVVDGRVWTSRSQI